MNRLALSGLMHGLRWQDAVDVLVLTALFSWAYRWLKHTIAVQVASGLLTLLAVSWIANHLGLILTSYLLSAVSAVATIVVVVVFQHEIRRGLSRVSPLGWVTKRTSRAPVDDTDAMVAEAAFALAARRKGALIVLPRHDSIYDLATPGTFVDARASLEVIEAIFTATSPLHDGAVVVSAGRLTRAGVVLPLATGPENPSFGTRHRAAIGLAQASDAMIVCVSEERGTVHLASGNAMDLMRDERHLRAALAGVQLGPNPADRERVGPSGRRFANPWPHLVIFGAVLAAWAALALDRSNAVTRVVPLEFRGVTDGLVFDPPRYSSVAVELRSSRRELEVLPSDSVASFVNLSGAKEGLHTYPIVTTAPAGIEVVSETPSSIQMEIRSRAPGNLPGGPRAAVSTGTSVRSPMERDAERRVLSGSKPEASTR
jgi:diadenylate cyclase